MEDNIKMYLQEVGLGGGHGLDGYGSGLETGDEQL